MDLFLTFDNGVVAAPVKEYADRLVTAAVHFVSLMKNTKNRNIYIYST